MNFRTNVHDKLSLLSLESYYASTKDWIVENNKYLLDLLKRLYACLAEKFPIILLRVELSSKCQLPSLKGRQSLMKAIPKLSLLTFYSAEFNHTSLDFRHIKKRANILLLCNILVSYPEGCPSDDDGERVSLHYVSHCEARLWQSRF